MIEKALRDQFGPIVRRRIRLYLAKHLTVSWLLCTGLGLILLGLHWTLGWDTTLSFWLLGILALVVTLWVINQSGKLKPDYQAVARTVEERHPDIKSLLLAALEQTSENSGAPLGYLQKRVIHDALTHAMSHDWMESISQRTVVRADLFRYASLLMLVAVLSQLLPSLSILPPAPDRLFTPKGTQLTVSPGDTSIETGSPVVIVARFDGIVPSEATLVTIGMDQTASRIRLNKSLNDPVFGSTLPSVASDLKYYIEYADQRSPDFHISVFNHPALEQMDAAIVFPAYTHLPQKVILDTQRISVVEGSKVTLTFTLNKPVATASLEPRLGEAPVLVMDSNYPNIYTTSLTATTSQRFELHLTDDQGRTNKVAPRLVMDVQKNMPPDLKPTFPGRDVEVSPLEELTLEADVSDDYGLINYGVTYTLAGSEGHTLSLGSSADPGQTQHLQTELTLEDMNSQPDQLLTYYYWADDIGPEGSVRRTTSDIYFAEVRPFEEIFRESESFNNQDQQQAQQGQSGRQQGRDELVQLQKQIITATWNIKQRTELTADANAIGEDLGVVSDSQSDALSMADEALSQADSPDAVGPLQAAKGFMETALDHLDTASQSASGDDLIPALGAEQSAYQELLKLREREYQITQSRNGRTANNNSARFNQQLRQLELRQQQDRYETQRLAQNQNQPQQRENLQVLNRLRDLARRQEEMANRLREAQAALQQAQTDEERQEALRQLKRLRDEQMQALDDVDELQQRMNQPENRQRMADTQQQLDDTRSRIQQSTQELEQGMLSRAITSTTRAQRQLDQMREDFQRSTSGQFAEDMRTLRQEAQDLDQQQQDIADRMREQIESRQKSLTDSNTTEEIAAHLTEQQQRTEDLINRMKEISEASETAEPLLSRKLYDTLRNVGTDNLDQSLQATEELVRRNFLPEAQRVERRAAQSIRTLREGVEDAARSILGDQAEALQQARDQLDNLIRDVNEESSRAASDEAMSNLDPNGLAQPGRLARNETSESGEPLAQEQQPTGPSNQPPQPGQSAEQNGTRTDSASQQNGTQQARDGGGGQQGQREGRAQTADNTQRNNPQAWNGRNIPEAWTGSGRGRTGPLTGENYTQWSDRLRDVEEMLDDQDLQNEAARVRDRARTIRAEYVRHGREPQWNLVEQDIMKPLVELRKQVLEKLAQLQSDDALVPIDRDPVPGRYAERVKRYFETLGEKE